MAKDNELDAVLAAAEDALTRVAVGTADIGEAWADVRRRIERVRPQCRQLRIALARLDESRTPDNADTARAHCRELRVALRELHPAAAITYRCDQPWCSLLESPRTTCWRSALEGMLPDPLLERLAFGPEANAGGPDLAIAHQDAVAAGRETAPKAARATPSLLRQTFDLFTLVVAYLQYYFIDVCLQIVSLPSLFP